jgi:hypothetical protein
MYRVIPIVAALFLLTPRSARADAFDHYINPILAKVPQAKGVKQVKQLTPSEMADHLDVLHGITGTFLVVKTNEGRFSKLLVQPAQQKLGDGSKLPIVVIDRYVTYKEGEEQAIQAKGENVRLFQDFFFNLDLGQVVPKAVGGDLRLVVNKDKVHLEPVGKAELYLVTKPLPEATPKKTGKLVVGKVFEAKYFEGKYKLYDDGRRTGTLQLKVDQKGNVEGWYISGKDGNKYEVAGKVGTPLHSITFTIVYPRSRQTFQGWMFTGDGSTITGSSRLQERDTGFYAVRLEE